MYKSLKSWLNIPIKIAVCTSVDGAGDKVFGDTIDKQCYLEHKVNVVRDLAGEEVVSNITVYLDPIDSITVSDEPIVDGVQRVVKAIGCLYEGGEPSIQVVYV